MAFKQVFWSMRDQMAKRASRGLCGVHMWACRQVGQQAGSIVVVAMPVPSSPCSQHLASAVM